PDGISQEVAALNITFRNSSITQAGDIQVKALRVRSADQVFENIFYDSTDDGWISISDLNPNSVNYKPAYGFRWNISDYTEEYNAGPGVFSAIIRLPVFVENKDSNGNNISPPDQTSDPNYASFKHSYHSLISEPAGEYDDAIFVYARSIHSDIQKEAIIARITDGKASESLRLTSSSQIFELDKDLNPVQGDVSGANAATISLSLDRQGNNQAIQWESAEVPIYSATTGNTITTYDATKGKHISSFAGDTYVRVKIEDFLNINQNPKNPETYIQYPVAKITVRSKAPQDIYGNNTGPELEEEVSIFVVREGSDNIVAALDNETHTCHFLARYEYEKNGLAETPQSNTSNNEYLNSGTTIKVLEGNRPLTFATNPSAGQFKVTATASTQNGQNEIEVGDIGIDTSDNEIAIVGDHSKILD
ncbi:MAG: hypothetical protein EBY39_14460, partial [Flavobacteriia bacterium]|nr:hypothetical protein [Flavobacteriia bacterium]